MHSPANRRRRRVLPSMSSLAATMMSSSALCKSLFNDLASDGRCSEHGGCLQDEVCQVVIAVCVFMSGRLSRHRSSPVAATFVEHPAAKAYFCSSDMRDH